MAGRFLTRVLVTAMVALIAAYQLKGIYIKNFATALIVAVVLSLLNSFIKPLLVFLTLPITIATLGLFLLLINILMVKFTAEIVNGFEVSSWISALLFSFIVAVVTSITESLTRTNRKRK